MADNSAWLIEASWSKPSAPAYLCVREDSGVTHPVFAWTLEWDSANEHLRALRFARKQDADAFVRGMWALNPQLFQGPEPIPPPRVASHGWMEKASDK